MPGATGATTSGSTLMSSPMPENVKTLAPVTSSAPSLPALPDVPTSLALTANRNASAYSAYPAARLNNVAAPYNNYNSFGASPYNRIGGYGGYGGGGMYGGGGYGSMYGGGMYGGGMGMGMGGPLGADPNDPNGLTHGFTQSTQATFQMIENIVSAFGGLAQMLESTYMATHSSFFGKEDVFSLTLLTVTLAMISVAEQFGNLRNTLGSILGIFTVLRWLRTLFARITGRPPPADAMSLTPASFASFTGQKDVPQPGARPRPSKKPFFFFMAAAFGLPYLLSKLIRALAASHEEEERRRNELQNTESQADAPVDPSKLDFGRLLYDFTPPDDAKQRGIDLSVKQGDLVAILSKSDPMGQPSEWWRCRTRDARVGYLPAVYLEDARKGAIRKSLNDEESIGGARTNGSQTTGDDASRSSSLTSGTLGLAKEKSPGRSHVPQVDGMIGDISVESFQKSGFYS